MTTRIYSSIFISLLSVVIGSGCQREDALKGGDNREIHFSTSMSSYEVKATDTAFEIGDAVGVNLGDPLNKTNVKLTFGTGGLTSENPIMWPEDAPSTQSMPVWAYYPYQEDVDIAQGFEFEIQVDQSTHARYTASDLMTATTSATPSDKEVHLSFMHRLSKVVFMIDNKLDMEIADVFLGNVYGRINSDVTEPTGNKGVVKAGAVTMDNKAAWAMILVPQTTTPKLMITSKTGEQFTYNVPAEVSFASGMCYYVAVTIGKRSIFTDFTSEITEWVDDGDIQFGDPVVPTYDNLSIDCWAGSRTTEVTGTLIPADYDWITMSQSGTTVNLTVQQNLTGRARVATYSNSNGGQLTVTQNGSVEELIKLALLTADNGKYTVNMRVASVDTDNYQAWGLVYGNSCDLSLAAKQVEGSTKVLPGGNTIVVEPTGAGPFYAWGYLTNADGTKSYSADPILLSSPITVTAGEDLQAIINEALDFSEIRVESGALFSGPVHLRSNITLSGGWINGFTEQDLQNRSVIEGSNEGACINASSSSIVDRTDYQKSQPVLSNVYVSGFEIRNGMDSGICFSGELTVENCWIHNCYNDDKGGAIQGYSDTNDHLVLANSIIEYNKANAHAGGVYVGGKSSSMTIINCLFRGNASVREYGYTAAIHGQSGVQAFIINNTIVENVNWRDGNANTSDPWSAVMFRFSGTHVVFVNNIVAGNYYFKPGVADDPANLDRYDIPIKPKYILEMQASSIDLNQIGSTDVSYICRSNLLGGSDPNRFIYRTGTDSARDAAQAACTFVHNNQYNSIFVDAANADFRPAGPALGVGEDSDIVRHFLEVYNTDLAGKPRGIGSKIYAGCYQP